MTTDIALRRSAASQVARMLASADGRAHLAQSGWTPGSPVLVVLESDTVGEMYERVISAGGPVPAILAVPHDDTIIVLSLSPVQRPLPEEDHTIGDTSSVGMLLEYLATRPGGVLVFQLAWTRASVGRAEMVAI